MIVAYIIAYIASVLSARAGHDILSGLILILIAIAFYVYESLKAKSILNLRGLFALSFIGGEGIACLKLSYIQTEWSITTWVCFFLAFMGVWLAFEITGKLMDKKAGTHSYKGRILDSDRFFVFIIILVAASLAAFIIEAAVLGFIPLFVEGIPHAYSYFHITGLHYLTVSCVLVPAFSVLWYQNKKEHKKSELIIMAVADIMALLIPVLCVSRFQLFAAVGMAIFMYILKAEKIPWKIIVPVALALVAAYLALSVARSHDDEYLKSIFEMKVNMPVNLSRIYIYIANNYDNFDCLVKELTGHTWGLRMLFPVWALTGLKFLAPSLVNFPFYLTKPELTTLTLFYDAYYDFGAAGVFVFSGIIGFVAYVIERMTRQHNDSGATMLYVQLALYLILAFFTTWFSNPTTFFYIAVTIICWLLCTVRRTE